jgi:hypothetical protein
LHAETALNLSSLKNHCFLENRAFTLFAGSYPQGIVKWADKDLTVTDLVSLINFNDSPYNHVRIGISHHD